MRLEFAMQRPSRAMSAEGDRSDPMWPPEPELASGWRATDLNESMCRALVATSVAESKEVLQDAACLHCGTIVHAPPPQHPTDGPHGEKGHGLPT